VLFKEFFLNHVSAFFIFPGGYSSNDVLDIVGNTHEHRDQQQGNKGGKQFAIGQGSASRFPSLPTLTLPKACLGTLVDSEVNTLFTFGGPL
jgi:hypothetical protein